MKNIILVFITLFFTSCGGGGGGSSSTTYTRVNPVTSTDKRILRDDEFSQYQWYRSKLSLDTLNQTYLGLNGMNADPVIVQIADDGIDADHEDLHNNMSFSSSYNVSNNTNNPSPSAGNSHGTQVAGIVAAVGYNNLGIKGVAPAANLAGFRFEVDSSGNLLGSQDDLERAWVTGANANNIVISNNSWGYCVNNDTSEENILKVGTEGGAIDGINYQALRNGKGRIYLFAGGNERQPGASSCHLTNGSSSNTSYVTNSQYSIAVAAMSENDKVTSYSSPGANILVSGYSGEDFVSAMASTVPTGTANKSETWPEDVDRNYTNSFSGTSASTPFVAGALALVLEACPNLTYRDVKYLIAKHATKVDPSNSSWVNNAAGFSHSNDYGFGLINPTKMINDCKSGFSSLGTKVSSVVSDTKSSPINTSKLTKTLTITGSLTIEWVGLTLTSNYTRPGDLQIKLISPSGTKSELIHFNNQLVSSDFYFSSGGRLSSQAFMGESAFGDWTVEITSDSFFGAGSLNGLSLEVVGH